MKAYDVLEARARSTDPETSHEAARSVRRISETHLRVRRLLELGGPQHDRSLFDAWTWHWENDGWPPITLSGLQTRRGELVKLGKVVDSGERRVLPTGRRSIVWKLAEEEK